MQLQMSYVREGTSERVGAALSDDTAHASRPAPIWQTKNLSGARHVAPYVVPHHHTGQTGLSILQRGPRTTWRVF